MRMSPSSQGLCPLDCRYLMWGYKACRCKARARTLEFDKSGRPVALMTCPVVKTGGD